MKEGSYPRVEEAVCALTTASNSPREWGVLVWAIMHRTATKGESKGKLDGEGCSRGHENLRVGRECGKCELVVGLVGTGCHSDWQGEGCGGLCAKANAGKINHTTTSKAMLCVLVRFP
jgi:hypothetical protein